MELMLKSYFDPTMFSFCGFSIRKEEEEVEENQRRSSWGLWKLDLKLYDVPSSSSGCLTVCFCFSGDPTERRLLHQARVDGGFSRDVTVAPAVKGQRPQSGGVFGG